MNLLVGASSSGDVHEDHTECRHRKLTTVIFKLYSCLFLTVTYVFCVGCFSDHSSVSNPCFAGLCPSLSEASSSMTEDNNGNF